MPRIESAVLRRASGIVLDIVEEGRVDKRRKYEFLSTSIGGAGLEGLLLELPVLGRDVCRSGGDG